MVRIRELLRFLQKEAYHTPVASLVLYHTRMDIHKIQKDLNTMAEKVDKAKANKNKKKQVPPKKKNSSLGIGYLYLFWALLMLGLGIMTPPLLSKHNPKLGDILSDYISTGRTVGRNLILGSQPAISLEPQAKPEGVFAECSEENLAHFVDKEGRNSNPGVHIFCFTENGFTLYKDSLIKPKSQFAPLPGGSELLEEIYGFVDPYVKSNTQPFAFFSINGKKLVGEKEFGEKSVDLLVRHGMVLLYEGGNWLWPGIRIGFKRQVDVLTGYPTSAETNLEIETLSMQPLVLSVNNFIAEKECDHIQKTAEPGMEYSQVSLMDKDKGRPASDFRTSQSYFLEANDEIMHALEERTASLTRVPKTHQEHTQVLRYGSTEKYDAHLDWFDPELYKQDPNTLSLIDNGKRNRLATVFWYLSDVEEGGHTIFPRFNAAPQPWVFDDCTKGLKVKPEKGKVIIFYSLLPNGEGDPLSLHGACPVEKGIKWAANKWVWNDSMMFVQ